MTNVTNTNITQVFLPNELKTTAAAVTTADTKETFVLAPRAADAGLFVLLMNPGADGAVQYEFADGLLGCPDGVNDPAQNTVAAGQTAVIKLDSAYVMQRDGTVELRVSPPAGKALGTMGVKVALVQNDLTV